MMQATRIIKEINPAIPIIALSAYSSEAEKQKAFMAGYDCCLMKPMERKALPEKIERYL